MMKVSLLFVVLSCGLIYRSADGEEQSHVEKEPDLNQDDPNNVYVSPQISGDACYLAENFDSGNIDVFKSRWIRSDAKKEDVDEDIAKYDGEWNIEAGVENSLNGDLGLALKSKAKHHAVSAFLNKPFRFNSKKPIIIQYDVRFQEGMECGGAYIKLISEGGINQLTEFQDKTPYTIMFGPDKCGNDHKLHFIFRYKSPKSEEFEEKHMAMPDTESFKHIFTDKYTHLLTLSIEADSSFELSLDQTVVKSGSLLKDFSPSVVPPAEIDDPEDKPEDWDERAKIPDPEAKKPDDWDESEPEKVVDPEDSKPEGWLEDEPSYIPDPQAVKPNDWDVDIDGEWEAPLIENPRCKPGCGEWKPAMIANPKFKGKWHAPQIENPNYKGVWKPKKIANPDFFEDKNPFENLAAISALGLELWSMSSEILFDNFLITSDSEVAVQYAADTWQKKKMKERSGYAASDSVIDFLYKSANQNPWLWIVYALVIILPITCCASYMLSKPKKKKSRPSSKVTTPVPSVKPDESSSTNDMNNRVNNSSRDQLEAAEEEEEEEQASPGPGGDGGSPADDEPEQSAKESLPPEQPTSTTASNVTVSSKGDLESREEEEAEEEGSEDENEGVEGDGEEGSNLVDSDDNIEDDDVDVTENESAIDGDENSQSHENTNLETPAQAVFEERTQPRQRKSRKD